MLSFSLLLWWEHATARHQLYLMETKRWIELTKRHRSLCTGWFMMKVSASSMQRPLILSNHSQSSTRLFAYYTVHWDQTQVHPSDGHPDGEMHFEINSCLYFRTDDGKDDEWEETRQDGSGYVVTYPPHLRPTNPLQIYNFDRSKDFLLTSDEVYSTSKSAWICFFSLLAPFKIESLDGYALEDNWDAVDWAMKRQITSSTLIPTFADEKVSNKWRINAFNLSTRSSFCIFICCLHHPRCVEFHQCTHFTSFHSFVCARSLSFAKCPHLEMLVKWTKKPWNNNSRAERHTYPCAHRLFLWLEKKC